ncbi:MAG: PAS domain S-box protein, partial [Deltaproteobacteria bacterium]
MRKNSSAKYLELLEAAPDAMLVVNEGGEIVLLNHQAERQFGYEPDELIGQQVALIVPQGFAARASAGDPETALQLLARPHGSGSEPVGRRKDGSAFPIEITLSPLESSEGVLVTVAIRDVSVRKDERKAAEAHLAQMEGRYRGLLEA